MKEKQISQVKTNLLELMVNIDLMCLLFYG